MAERERIVDLDVLRGVALLGVFLVNLTGFAGEGIMATRDQLAALPTAGIDRVADFLVGWLVENKANTTFAFLFGLGFYLQMERAEAKGPGFARMYARRLAVLLAFGWFHMVFLWTWDILHLYAMTGFLLLALRGVSNRVLLLLGVPLLLMPFHVFDVVAEWTGVTLGTGANPFSDAAVLARQGAADDYRATVAGMWQFGIDDYFLNLQVFGWTLYALGRFLVGAYVGRRRWLQDADAVLPAFRQAARVLLPAGLLLSLAVEWMSDLDDWETAALILQPCAAAVLAAGYLSGVVVALRSGWGRRLFAPFRHAGQMALTNYVAQSFVYGFLLFGIGPGLGLAGRLGTTACVAIVAGVYALQLAGSAWWLRCHRFGPLEWCWRALTYGERPAMRRR